MDREVWNNLIILAKVIQHGNFTKASKELNISPSAISHTIKKLETKLNTRLLHRSTRSISATATGLQLIAQVNPVLENLEKTIQSFEETEKSISGTIKITSHRVAVAHTINPKLKQFRELYPFLTLEFDINDSLVDFIAAGFDAGIRRSESLEQDMIAVKLDEGDSLIFVASPEYLSAKGQPRKPQDLEKHNTIGFRFPTSGKVFNWPFKDNLSEFSLNLKHRLIFNDAELLVIAALAGNGIACIAESQVTRELKNGDLIQLFTHLSSKLPPNYLYFSGRSQIPKALRAFIDFMKV